MANLPSGGGGLEVAYYNMELKYVWESSAQSSALDLDTTLNIPVCDFYILKVGFNPNGYYTEDATFMISKNPSSLGGGANNTVLVMSGANMSSNSGWGIRYTNWRYSVYQGHPRLSINPYGLYLSLGSTITAGYSQNANIMIIGIIGFNHVSS